MKLFKDLTTDDVLYWYEFNNISGPTDTNTSKILNIQDSDNFPGWKVLQIEMCVDKENKVVDICFYGDEDHSTDTWITDNPITFSPNKEWLEGHKIKYIEGLIKSHEYEINWLKAKLSYLRSNQ